MKLTDYKPEGRFFGMFISESGSGKSVAAASFPKTLEVIDTDLRARGILGGKDFLEDLDKIEVKAFPPDKGFADIEKYLVTLQLLIQARQPHPATIVIDSITSLNRTFITDAMELTVNEDNKRTGTVRKMGSLKAPGVAAFNYESEACYQVFDMLRALPINVIVSAHIVDKYGKPPGASEFSESTIIGKKLSIRDKIGTNILTYFDEVYEFKREEVGNQIKYSVKFKSEIAKTSYNQLPNGWVDITNKNFYKLWLHTINEADKKG